ncbi:ABC transporter ATP-binding protein [Insolitispirillum peregrinum]|uniref:ABC-2 type transport system ATP-binding protein n=1 Tax=Insolitispirillum peregrinum TaxID=80876 RepID=A0A1N7JI00_9PROT|nr:ABC transporter ATP-binding protein [Insolitispirillum peregrinum]SIS48940.1 ABC-2 type transport system ATP-binding protein [Insolitispirillum peregrinum]
MMPDECPPAIRVHNLTKIYSLTPVVDGLSFEVPQGSITALLGGNGAGKTTTIAMLLGLLLPTSGQVALLGHDMATDRYAALAQVNFSSPYVDLPGRLTVRENLTIYARLYGLPRPAERIAEMVEDLELGAFVTRRTSRLSAGQKTRVALAKALINRPRLLILDEPTASLDPDSGDWIRGYLSRYAAETGATLFLASHNMAEVERLCSQVLMMRQGRIFDRGSVSELTERYGRTNLEDVFLDIARGQEKGGPAQ